MRKLPAPEILRTAPGPLLLLATITLIEFSGGSLEPLFLYNRDRLQEGQLWRLIGGHLAHTNLHHTLLNGAGLLTLWILHSDHYRPATFAGVTAFLALACGAGLYLFSPDIHWYLGLSGVLHGLIIWGAGRDILRGWRGGYLLLAGTWLKIAYEQLAGTSHATAELIGAEVAVDAHLWGAVAGSTLFLGALLRRNLWPQLRGQSLP